jgi:formylglycine-generating enzyme required for sulfatase activity
MKRGWIWGVLTVALGFAALTAWEARRGEAAPGSEKRVALVIGNSDYADAGRLKNPVNDAEDVAAALGRLGFDVTPVMNSTGAAMTDAVETFFTKASGARVAFFYYAGHGLQYEGAPYLAPIDAKLLSETAIKREAFAAQDIVSRLETSARASIVVLDACRNNPLAERLQRKLVGNGRSASVGRGLSRMETAGGNTLLVYSAGPGQVAEDGDGRNSPFTTAFLKHAETPGLEVEQMLKRVTAEVETSTGGKQQPERLSKLKVELWLKEGAAGSDDVSNLQAQLSELRAKVAALSSPPAKPPVENQAKPAVGIWPEPAAPTVGETIQDCADCPEMVVVPAGRFMMGSPADEPERESNEDPQRRVTIAKPFAVGKYAVTFAEWDACVANGGCGGYRPADEGWGRGDHPVINVNWDDAKAYVTWLSRKTGKSYRLPSEVEWEYVARAGTTTPFWWGRSITPAQANYDGGVKPYKGGGKRGGYRRKTVPVKSFTPNPWGLYQVHGNVYEWTEDCWDASYDLAPTNDSANTGNCKTRVVRGGSWYNSPRYLRAAFRNGLTTTDRVNLSGFRVVRTLNPES